MFFSSFSYSGFKPGIRKPEFLWIEPAPDPDPKHSGLYPDPKYKIIIRI